MFVDYTVFYDIWSLKVSKTTEMELLIGSPITLPTAHFCFTTPQSFSPPTLGTTGLDVTLFVGCLVLCLTLLWKTFATATIISTKLMVDVFLFDYGDNKILCGGNSSVVESPSLNWKAGCLTHNHWVNHHSAPWARAFTFNRTSKRQVSGLGLPPMAVTKKMIDG